VSASSPLVLLIDDNHAARELARIAFAESGTEAEVETASSLAEARARLASSGALPHLVLLDISLGDGSGHELLAEIRGSGELGDLPVVMLTSSDLPADRERAKALGANGYLVKPNSFDAFVVALVDLLARCAEWLPGGAKR
jgi:CheY-like chemotaxis protein